MIRRKTGMRNGQYQDIVPRYNNKVTHKPTLTEYETDSPRPSACYCMGTRQTKRDMADGR